MPKRTSKAENAPQQPTLAQFRQGWLRVQDVYLPKNPGATPVIHFSVTHEAAAWVGGVVAYWSGRNPKPGEDMQAKEATWRAALYGSALTMGTFCTYTALQGRKPLLRSPAGNFVELPEMAGGGFTEEIGTQPVHMPVSRVMWSLDAWRDFDVGMHRNHVIHAGLHVLGGLAMMPRGSEVVVADHTAAMPFLKQPLYIGDKPALQPTGLIGNFQVPQA